MTNNPGPYEAVIADLKQQRDKIDHAIKALEELTGGVDEKKDVRPASAGRTSPAEGAFLGMSIAEATKALLHARKKALGNAEIVKELEAGGMVLSSENKTNTVGSVLNRRSKKVRDIVSLGRGRWGLKEWYPNRRFGQIGERRQGFGV